VIFDGPLLLRRLAVDRRMALCYTADQDCSFRSWGL
jgi:hypothetical protein